MSTVWITNGEIVKRVSADELPAYELKGFVRGKKRNGETIVAWNKGKTRETDSRVASYLTTRPSRYKKQDKTILLTNDMKLFFDGNQRKWYLKDSNDKIISEEVKL